MNYFLHGHQNRQKEMFPHSNWQSNWQLPGKKHVKYSIYFTDWEVAYPETGRRQSSCKARLGDHLPRGPGSISATQRGCSERPVAPGQKPGTACPEAPPCRRPPSGISHLSPSRTLHPISHFSCLYNNTLGTLKSKGFFGFSRGSVRVCFGSKRTDRVY